MKKITITIDGGAGVGKGVTAKGVARVLGYKYIDTGAIYRAITLYVLDHAVDVSDEVAVVKSLQEIAIDFFFNAKKMTNEIVLNSVVVENQIRTLRVDDAVSKVSAYKKVREFVVLQISSLAEQKAVVLDGRDGGTVIAPYAELKIHLIADIDVRTQRRQQQLRESGLFVSFDVIKNNLIKRDYDDYNGDNPSSTISDDAIVVDTTHHTIDSQIDYIVGLAVNKLQ